MSVRSSKLREAVKRDRYELAFRAAQDRDEQVFNELAERWSGMMLRLAFTYVESRAIAD